MNPSGKPDKNLIDINPTWSGAPGNPAVLTYGVVDASVLGADGQPVYTGAFKATGAGVHDLIINVEEIIGGSETHIDANNRAARIVFNVGKYTNKFSEYISSVKGGCEDIAINGPVAGAPLSKGVHHIDGNWSDQSSAITRGTKLGLLCAYGEGPIRYDQLNSAGVTNTSPQIINRRLFIPGGTLGISIVWFFWGLLKKLKLA